MTIDAIRTYIQVEILGDPEFTIDADQDLLLSETLDSLSVVRLVAHLEQETGLEIPPEDVTLENFASLSRIDEYLGSRRE
ncbi:MAG: acyl carrier protein [Planctomycetota bacterium]